MSNRYVLIRGLMRGNGHWGSFLEVLKNFDPDCEIELFEIPGNGTSYQEITPNDPSEIIAAFRHRSRFCNEKKPFILCGLSLGGMLALKWLELFPEDVQKTFVINSSLHLLSPFYHRLDYSNYFKVIKIILTRSVESQERQILRLTSNKTDLDPKVVSKLIEFSVQHPLKISNFFRQIELARNIHVGHRLKAPITILCSDKDRLVNPNCSKKLAEFLNASLVMHPTAGHDIPLDDSQWLAEILTRV